MILLMAAVPLETALIRARLSRTGQLEGIHYRIAEGTINRQQVMLAHSGIGQINMAMQLSRILSRHRPDAVFLFGCGGAYPSSALGVGDVVLASEEILGDTGIAQAARFTPLAELDIPQNPDLAPAFRQRISLNRELQDKACAILGEIPHGPFVTVSCGSGHQTLSEQLASRTEGLCENMEGAAAARVCAEFHVPMLEIRGISNPTGTRDPVQWDIGKGVEAAQLSILALLESWH